MKIQLVCFVVVVIWASFAQAQTGLRSYTGYSARQASSAQDASRPIWAGPIMQQHLSNRWGVDTYSSPWGNGLGYSAGRAIPSYPGLIGAGGLGWSGVTYTEEKPVSVYGLPSPQAPAPRPGPKMVANPFCK